MERGLLPRRCLVRLVAGTLRGQADPLAPGGGRAVNLSFAPNGSLILVSASRDKTLRVWDLSRDGRSMRGCPRCWGTPS
uniref:Uncharacterized protein n=1 Tax=Accipiter nisus TaxID=211598 RepID=A0A8B9NEP9_9AVES